MATRPTGVFGPQTLTNVAASIFAAPLSPAIIVVITRLMVLNITAGAITLKVWLVRYGQAGPVDANLIVGASAAGLSIAAGPTDGIQIKSGDALVLNPGDAIWAQASANTALNLTASGWTI